MFEGANLPFSQSSSVFPVGISESQRFWTACCRCWSFGVDSFFVLFITSGEFKVCAKIIFWERSWLLGGVAGRQTQHFRIFCSPNALFFGWMFSLSCELFRDFKKNNQIEFLRSLRGEKSSFFRITIKKREETAGDFDILGTL